jgi:hypothetical protein
MRNLIARIAQIKKIPTRNIGPLLPPNIINININADIRIKQRDKNLYLPNRGNKNNVIAINTTNFK